MSRPNALSDRTLRALLREYTGGDFSAEEIGELRPHIERQLDYSRQLRTLDLGGIDPWNTHFLQDVRLDRVPEPRPAVATRTPGPKATPRSQRPGRQGMLATLPIHELAPLVARRQVSPVDVTRELLERIETLDKRLNAFAT